MLASAVNAQEIHIRVLDAQNGKGITQQMGQRDRPSCSEQGRVNADTRRLARKANVTRLAVYTASLVSDGEESVEANCFRARNNLERIAPGGTCSIAPASSVVYS